jgi:ABC-type lipoprotein release transport system permease subunit
VKGTNMVTLLGACFILVLSASLASALPARNAASVEPMQALRTE